MLVMLVVFIWGLTVQGLWGAYAGDHGLDLLAWAIGTGVIGLVHFTAVNSAAKSI